MFSYGRRGRANRPTMEEGGILPGSVLWFILILLSLPIAWFLGQRASAIRDVWRRGVIVGGVFLLLLGWAALIHNPTVAVELIPLSILARLEGIGAAPLFVFVVAVGWRLSYLRRQRAIMIVGLLLGAGYLLQGGMWMMQPTPTNAFDRGGHLYYVPQTQDYSCVPAACTTTLRLLGVQTSEAEMAELTETRPGSGATLIRAFNGISEKLEGSSITPSLLERDYEQLMRLQPPMLTPMRYESARLHMVTIVEVRPHRVVIIDPQIGIEFVRREEFLQYYRGQVIAFDGGSVRATTRDLLAQHPLTLDPDHPEDHPRVSQVAYPINSPTDAP